jgi:hypothetical protein
MEQTKPKSCLCYPYTYSVLWGITITEKYNDLTNHTPQLDNFLRVHWYYLLPYHFQEGHRICYIVIVVIGGEKCKLNLIIERSESLKGAKA